MFRHEIAAIVEIPAGDGPGMPPVRRKPAPVGPNPGTAYAGMCRSRDIKAKAGCAMGMLLTVLMIYFGLVLLWAAPRLCRLLQSRMRLMPDGSASADCLRGRR